ncbi:MAG: hypothetical protein M3Y65_19595 [Pseudomonadota bacterium]|nr:hypothetical protein [Pseudomonadota bacterium]
MRLQGKLNQDEMDVLLALEQGQWRGALEKEAPMPRRLFEFGLVARQPDGELSLSKQGERALFQHKCVAVLGQIGASSAAADDALDGSVERWLVSSGFIAGTPNKITKRGQLWLDSVTGDAGT